MKKKILVYSLGLVVCLAAIGSIAVQNAETERVEIVTEEKKVPVRNASDTWDAGALSEETSLTEMIDDTEGAEKTTEYLNYYFDISLEKDGFIESLKKICPMYTEESMADEESDLVKKAAVSGEEMIKAAVIAVEKEALAQTYSDDKTETRLEFYGIHDINKKKADKVELRKYIVCALDLGMIDEEMAQSAINGALTEVEQAELLMSVANIGGKGRNYIGYSNDENIYADLRLFYGLYLTFAEAELSEIAGIALEDKNVQECVLKKADYAARFLPALTICYSHESVEHMEQLIGLLNSENIVAKVQLEPKMIITKEDIRKAEKAKEEAEDKKENNKEINKENKEESKAENIESMGTLKYDLVFEFENKEDMARFGEVVEKFAKVQETIEEQEEGTETITEEKVALIADSEIEAVYMAEEAEHMLSDETTREIEKITVESDNGTLEFYCLVENAEEIKGKVLELAKGQELSITEIKTEKNENPTEEVETVKGESKEESSETEAKKADLKETQAQSEEETEELTLEENEKEENMEFRLKLYSKKYICNKEFFFKMVGVDVEENEDETEETTTEQDTQN